MWTINRLDYTLEKWIQLGRIFFSYDEADDELERMNKLFPHATIDIFELY